MSPQPGTPFFDIITIPISLYRDWNGDDRFSEVYRARQTSEDVHVDPPERNLGESEAPRYTRTINLALGFCLCSSGELEDPPGHRGFTPHLAVDSLSLAFVCC